MPRYYLVCEFTPSHPIKGYRDSFRRVFVRPPQGFLFHDTEKPLQVRDILLPLHRISELFEGATKALVIRKDTNTLVATFSLSGFPRPVRIKADTYRSNVHSVEDYEWLERNGLKGWLIPDVHQPANPPIACDPDSYYSQCLELMRYTNSCPCPLLATGECVEKYVYPNLPDGFTPEVMRSDYRFDDQALKRVRYKSIAGFEFITGAITSQFDFTVSLRPWDDHDFKHISERKRELSARGTARHLRARFRKAACAACCFSEIGYRNVLKDCGNINSCKESTNEATAWALIFDWYNKSNFENMPGFTHAQRNWLIKQVGEETLVKAIASRRTKTIYGGFVQTRAGEWRYRLSASVGSLNRFVDIATWDILKTYIPDISVKINPVVTWDSKIKLACAILGAQHNGITEQYKGWYPIRKVQVQGDTVTATGAATRYESVSKSLSIHKGGDVKEFYRSIWGYRFSEAPEWARKVHLTVAQT